MIRVEGLTKRFGPLVAVDDLDFDVHRGELFGLVGPDGAGKTTILRMLAGVLAPSAGDAVLNGLSVVHDPEAVKADLAYMSQRFGLYTDLTVLENLEFYADLYRVPKGERARRLERLYRFSNLGPFQDRLAGQLSGGMKQKLGLSCALIHEPLILLLDEPTFGVDPISRRDLWLIVHEMVAGGVTVIVSTAYMDEAERFDRVALLNEGGAVALARPQDLQAQLEGKIIAVQVERLRKARDLLRDTPGIEQAAVFGDRLHVTLADPAMTARLGPRLEEAGFRVRSITAVTPSMEDVFMNRIRAAA